MESRHPNIFDFATSELSQDAFLCWLLAWAKSDLASTAPALHEAGKRFLDAIYAKCGQVPPDRVETVDIQRQHKYIDIVARINERDTIAIEDKVQTEEHSDQLPRYLTVLREEYGNGTILPIYVQTGNQSNYSGVTGAGFKPFVRSELIEVFAAGGADVHAGGTLHQFILHLQEIEAEVEAFRHAPLDEWDSSAWQGFYTTLQNELGDGNYAYVPNRRGGFMGFYWYWQLAEDGCKPYLQLEEGTFCFKIAVEDPEKRRACKYPWHDRILEAAENSPLSVVRPSKFGDGECMTIAVIEGDYRALDHEGKLDIAGTLGVLREAQAVLSQTMARQQGVESDAGHGHVYQG